MIEFLGILAGIFTTFGYFPQIFKTVKLKSAEDISYGMPILLGVGILLWLIYGIILHNFPLILANSISLMANIILIFLKIKYGNNKIFN